MQAARVVIVAQDVLKALQEQQVAIFAVLMLRVGL